MRYRLWLAAACAAWLASPSPARVLENWPYERLFKEADLVVIATAVSTESCADRFTDHTWPCEFAGLTTKFEVKSAVKGQPDGKEIKVLHFRFGESKKEYANRPGPFPIIDGPLFVAFRTKSIKVTVDGGKWVVPSPEYMLFLKRLKDGRYEPVSGKVDPQLSVRELFKPLPEKLGGSQRHE